MLLVSPNPLAGIGQVMSKYAELLNGELVRIEDTSIDYTNQEVFAFALPLPEWIEKLKCIKKVAKSVVCMCVCETEPVHPSHEHLFRLFDQVAVPSQFCVDVFSKQFPFTEFVVVRHWDSIPKQIESKVGKDNYTFYHIGNILDRRKQINRVVDAFKELKLPGARLMIKATCKQNVRSSDENVVIINGLLPPGHLERIHKTGDCYVSFSCSEGVGMGAVEAALRDKPVIITDYGGAKEYVKTPYTIPCSRKCIGINDFLYTGDMVWGDPSYEHLKMFMKQAFEMNLRHMSHDHTRNLIDGENITHQLRTLLEKSRVR
jgi:glycosyltransferase involved in cell wall biosynthesis